MIDYFFFIVYKIFEFFVRIIPVKIIPFLLNFFAKFIYLVDKKHVKVALANIKIAFPNKSQDEKIEIIKASYENLIFNLYEFILNKTRTICEMDEMVEVLNEEYILDCINNDETIIAVTAHYGDWKFLIPYVAVKYKAVTIVHKPVKNEYLNRELIKKTKNGYDIESFSKRGSAKSLIKALKKKRIVAMAIEQNIKNDNLASVVNLFGIKATQANSPIRLASKMKAVVLPLIIERIDINHHKIIFYPPIKVAENITQEKIDFFSQAISDVFEKHIKEKPNHWFWQHRRFKEFHPDIYK